MNAYAIPAEPIMVEEIIKNSQFITRLAYVDTAEKAKAFIKHLNHTFPEATHHCWAYIVGNPKSTTLIGCSDDGEPSGTAGKPMLNILQHADNLGDVVAVCTRFYGGTKLGTGGLTRAYGGGVKLALEKLQVKQKIAYQRIRLTLDYAQQKDAEHLLKDFETEDINLEFQTQVELAVSIAASQINDFKQALKNKFKGQIQLKKID
jgi:uncharacterized YigZ family protein